MDEDRELSPDYSEDEGPIDRPVEVYERPDETTATTGPSMGSIVIGLVVILIIAFLLVQFVF